MLSFRDRFNKQDEFETEQKGDCGNALVQLPTGEQYSVTFYCPVTLAQKT